MGRDVIAVFMDEFFFMDPKVSSPLFFLPTPSSFSRQKLKKSSNHPLPRYGDDGCRTGDDDDPYG